jgi:hypothetical protein
MPQSGHPPLVFMRAAHGSRRVTAPRFTVERRLLSVQVGRPPRRMWAVCDHGRRITKGFESYGEAQVRCTRIASLYARWGW